MFKPINPKPEQLIFWAVKAATTVYKGQLVKSDSGAAPVAAAHTGATILGVALEGGTAGEVIPIYPVFGAVFDVDFLTTGTKKTFTDADLGSAFDIAVANNNQAVKPDDTDGAFLHVVGYNNELQTVRVKVEVADTLLA